VLIFSCENGTTKGKFPICFEEGRKIPIDETFDTEELFSLMGRRPGHIPVYFKKNLSLSTSQAALIPVGDAFYNNFCNDIEINPSNKIIAHSIYSEHDVFINNLIKDYIKYLTT
jgi:hypothetical protein